MNIDHILRIGLVVMFAAFVAAIWGPMHDVVVRVGDTAPKFSITADNGERISARDFNAESAVAQFLGIVV